MRGKEIVRRASMRAVGSGGRFGRMVPVAALSVTMCAAATPGVAAAAPGSLDWTPCATPDTAPTLQCADLDVPLVRARPGRGTITLRLNKIPAADPAGRIGSLVTNPGGPGGPGTDTVAYGGLGLATPEFAEVSRRFDLVGFDPRGVGRSTPAVACDPATLFAPAVDRFPADAAAYAGLVAHNRSVGADCLDRTGPLLSNVDTRSVADDVEAIRIALGEPRLSWLGVSYGTEIGELYAAKYPDRVRAMVLDGAIDHARPMRQAIVEEAAATEDGLRRFAGWCSAADECALHGQDVLARYDELMAEAVAHGVPSSGLGRPATADELAAGAYGYLNFPATWPQLADSLALAGGDEPDAVGLTEAMPFGGPGYPAYRAVGCHDFPSPFTGPSDMRASADLLRAVAPHSWRYSEFWDFASGCTGWPVPAGNPPRPGSVTGTDSALVVGNRHDPATPLAWARGLAARIDNAALLTYAGDGHTGVYNSACVRSYEADYLVSGITPGPGAVCPVVREQAGGALR